MAEHIIAVKNSAELVEDLDAVVNRAIMPREAVETPGREYIAHFRHHMAREEADLFPIVAQTLTAKDWAAIDAAVKPAPDPLFGVNAPRQYEVLRREIVGASNVSAEI